MRFVRRKNTIKIFLAFVIFIAFMVLIYSQFQERLSKTLLITINDQDIFISDIESKLTFSKKGKKSPEINDLSPKFARNLVKNIYFDKKIENIVLKTEFGKSKKAEVILEEARNKALYQIYYDTVIKSSITDEMVMEKYNEIRRQFEGMRQYNVYHIMLPTYEEVDWAYNKIKKKPALFRRLAKKHSIDVGTAEKEGNMGYLLANDFVYEIADAVLSARPGIVSKPIQDNSGWHLIMVSDIRDVKIPQFSVAEAKIREFLIAERIAEENAKIMKGVDDKISQLTVGKEGGLEAEDSENEVSTLLGLDAIDSIILRKDLNKDEVVGREILKLSNAELEKGQ